MRHWLCMLVLLFSLAGQGEPVAARVPDPVPIERPIEAWQGGRLVQAAGWWQRS